MNLNLGPHYQFLRLGNEKSRNHFPLPFPVPDTSALCQARSSRKKMPALERASPDQVLVFLCSHAGVCLTSALIPPLENPRPSESQLEAAAWSPAVERDTACPSS